MAATHKEIDIAMMLAAKCHLGSKNCDYQMERYISRRQNTGIYVINLQKTWEKLIMAARVIVAVENPQDVCVLSARTYGQRAVLKFCQYTGCKALAGRHTPGTFTNQIQKRFEEPRLLILTDPRYHIPSISCCLAPARVAPTLCMSFQAGMTSCRVVCTGLELMNTVFGSCGICSGCTERCSS